MLHTALLLVSIFGSTLARCPLGSVQGIGRNDCFMLSHYADTWYGAEGDCRSKNGHLTSVSSAFTNAFLRDQCARWNCGTASSFWLGASEISSNGSWTWSDGTRFSYYNWAPGEPSNDTAHCLAAYTQNGLWFPQPCYDTKPYICSMPAMQEECPSSTTPSPVRTTCESVRHTSSNVSCPQLTCPPPPPSPACSCQPRAEPTTATTPAPPRCDAGWTYSPVTKECWTMKLDTYNIWSTEVNICASHNSTAISIHSSEANHAAAVFAQANNYYGKTAVWIGLYSQPAHGGQWHWVDNSSYNYAANLSYKIGFCTVMFNCNAAMSIVSGSKFGEWRAYYTNGIDNGPDGGQPIICAKPAYY